MIFLNVSFFILVTAIACLKTQWVVCLTEIQVRDHPLAHSVMVGVDCVAKIEGGGAHAYARNHISNGIVIETDLTNENSEDSKCKFLNNLRKFR